MAIGKLSNAITSYNETLRLDPRRADVHDKLGLTYTEQSHALLGAKMADQNKLAMAVKEHKQAIEIDHSNGWFQHNLGMAYERQRKYSEAAAQYEKTVALAPNLGYTRYRLGMIYSRSRKYEEAMTQYRQALNLEPDNSLFHYALGTLFNRMDKTDAAIQEFQKAIDLDFYNTQAHFGLANTYLKQGRRDEGEAAMTVFKQQRKGNLADLERSVVVAPDNPNFHFELALVYAKQDRYIKAIKEFKLAIALDPFNTEYHQHLGNTYRKAGLYKEAETQHEIVRKRSHKQPKLE